MEFFFRKINVITNIHIYRFHTGTKKLTCFETLDNNLITFMIPEHLCFFLTEKANKQDAPVIYQDANKVIFCCIKGMDGCFYLLGPACTEELTYVEIHNYYKKYGMHSQEEQHPPKIHIQKLLAMIALLTKLITNRNFENQELLDGNQLTKKKLDVALIPEITLIDEEDAYHHTYQEEVRTMNYVREGNIKEITAAGELLANAAGKLSENDFRNERNLAICAVTISTRAAIDGGVSPTKSYQLSDRYINKIDQAKGIVELFEYRKQSLYDFTVLVVEERKKRIHSSYVEQCKDYIRQYYHQKLYLTAIAGALGVSESHLAKVFKKETGTTIWEFVLRFRVERAANLLKYSEYSLSEISDYVCFNSQSHFGKVFKQFKHMSPGHYRKEYQQKEFSQGFYSDNKMEL